MSIEESEEPITRFIEKKKTLFTKKFPFIVELDFDGNIIIPNPDEFSISEEIISSGFLLDYGYPSNGVWIRRKLRRA
jgi:hypothetical protein